MALIHSKNRSPSCSEYRREMMLLGLKKRLNAEDLPAGERRIIQAEIKKLERQMQLE